MKIFFALTYYDSTSFVGGTQSLAKRLSKELSSENIDITVLTVNHKGDESADDFDIRRDDEVRIISFPPSTSALKDFFKKILKRFVNVNYLLKKRNLLKFANEADALVFFDVNEMTFPFYLKKISALRAFYCCTLVEKENYFKKTLYARRLLKKSSDIYLASNTETKKVLERLGIGGDRIKIIPYGIDTGKYCRKEEYSFEDKRIGFLGGIEQRKGIHILLKACRDLDISHKLFIAGQIREKDYFEKIRDDISKLGEKGNCKAEYVGCVPDEEIVSFYGGLSVFVCPSLSEEFGIVALEAMACEIPVIASAEGGLKTIINDGENGLLFEKGNDGELKDKLTAVLTDRGYALKLARNGRKRVQEIYSIKKTAQLLSTYISEMIKN